MQVINCRGQHSMCRFTYISTDSKTYALFTSVHNDADNTDTADDAYNYNRVIGIAQLKAFSCTDNIEYLLIQTKIDCMSHIGEDTCYAMTRE